MREFTFKISSSLSVFALLLVGFTSCEDVFENNLTEQEVTILTPPNGSVLQDFDVQFVWEELDDALEYQVQIVRPSFDWIEGFVVDTPVVGNQFLMQLAPNNYQWRIRAVNGSTETEWFAASFTVDSIASVANAELVLISPADDVYLNSFAQTFEWSALSGADDYEFELRDDAGNLVLNPIITTYDTVNLTLTEMNYEWSVRGRNSTSNTLYSTRTLGIDVTAPQTPVLNAPNDFALLHDTTLEFTWTRGADLGANPSPQTDELYIHSDTAQGSIFSYVGNSSYIDSLGVGTWYWHVKTTDAAGNSSAFTNWRSFVIQ